ncbi:MAG: hypothetical protein KC495_11485 [Dehalococcoidia bacterium]|nr:hypothetical protein [Dehalococcoidia bacterium]MCB9486290.1 hypothetical protein [Thermoflexaceae bacterium]
MSINVVDGHIGKPYRVRPGGRTKVRSWQVKESKAETRILQHRRRITFRMLFLLPPPRAFLGRWPESMRIRDVRQSARKDRAGGDTQ